MAHSLHARTSAPSASPISTAGWHAVEHPTKKHLQAVARRDGQGGLEYARRSDGGVIGHRTLASALEKIEELNALESPSIQLPELADREVHFDIAPTWGRWLALGRHDQIADLVPAHVEWPRPGECSDVTWTVSGLQYFLKRVKPEGTNLRKAEWARVDWWHLRCADTVLDYTELGIRFKTRQIEEARRWQQQGADIRSRHRIATTDRRFQAMLAQILPPKKGARRDGTP